MAHNGRGFAVGGAFLFVLPGRLQPNIVTALNVQYKSQIAKVKPVQMPNSITIVEAQVP